MKKTFSGVIVFMAVIITAMLCTVLSAGAATWGDYKYEVMKNGDIKITGCVNSNATNIKIPSSINNKPVTAIGNDAFSNNKKIKSVTLAEGITTIGDCAFNMCSSLESITIPSSMREIGSCAFSYCTALKKVYAKDIASWVKIQYGEDPEIDEEDIEYRYNSATPLNTGADLFFGNTCVSEKLTIPGNIKSIGSYAFYGLNKLESVVLSDGVLSVDDYAFSCCENLKKITIPYSAKSIYDRAFAGCFEVTDIYYAGTPMQWEDMDFFSDDFWFSEARIHYGKADASNLVSPQFVTADQTASTIKLTWSKVEGANVYAVYNIVSGELKKLLETTSLTATIKNLKAGTKCTLAVRAGKKTNEKITWSSIYATLIAATNPEKVTGLKSTQTTSSIKLTWKAVSGATGYRIYKYNAKTKKYESYGYIPGKTEFNVSKLSVGTKYKFRIRAYINTERGHTVWGEYSDEFLTSTNPAKTTGLKAAQSTSAIKLTWKAVSGATGYRIYKYNSKTKKYESVGFVPGKTEFTVSKLSVGTKYKFKVRAYINTDLGAVWGEYTDELLTSTKPAKTTGLKATQSTSAIKLTWKKVSGATGYRIYKYNSKTKKYESVGFIPGKTEFTVSKLSAGTKYKFKVRAYINTDLGAVWGEYTDILETATKPSTPSVKATSTAKGKINLAWTNVAGESGYEVYYSTKKDSGYKKLSTTKANVSKATVTKLTSGKTYYFRIRAIIKTANGTVCSGYKTVGVKVK